MKQSTRGWLPKYNGLGYVLAVAALAVAAMAATTWVPRWLPVAPPVRRSVAEVQDAETLRIERATENLRQAAMFERTQRTVREDGSESIVALFSPTAASAASAESKPIDASILNVVILENARRRTAMIEGVPVRVGERTPSGGVVRAIEKTGVVIEDGAGARRTVDIRDRFVRPDAPRAADDPAASPRTTVPATDR
ncbi:MAG: hypothetical protein ACRYGA_14330 [Janthinobacterium lividum]